LERPRSWWLIETRALRLKKVAWPPWRVTRALTDTVAGAVAVPPLDLDPAE
jgi:hypothetical protein